MKNIKWIWLLVCTMMLSTPIFVSCGKSGDDLIEKPEDVPTPKNIKVTSKNTDADIIVSGIDKV